MSARQLPTLIEDRPQGTALALIVGGPAVFGIVTGLMLGVSEPVYLVLSLLGIGGGFFAGFEHADTYEGFYRGLIGGLLFGFFILATHGVVFDDAPKAKLPDPAVLLIGITAVAGAFLGWLGSRRRVRSLDDAGLARDR